MKLAEHFEDLAPKLAGDLERALDSVRKDFEDRITATVERTVAAAAEEAATLAKEAAQAVEAPAAPAAVSLDAADELRLAALDIDTAATQSEILEALSRGVLRFASRVAIFVNRGKELQGWSAAGFGEADSRIKDVSLGGGEPFPAIDHLHEGSVALSSLDCALICNALDAEHPSMGLLLPFVLGPQVVGTVYCDRLAEDTFSVSALQLLTYVAGETLETLPVRKRESTATLSLASPGTELAEPAATIPAPSEAPIPIEDAAPEAVEAVAEPEAPAAPAEATTFESVPEETTEDLGGTIALPEPKASLPEPAADQPAEPDPVDLPAIPAMGEESTPSGSLIPEAGPVALAPDTPAAAPTPRIEPPAEPTLSPGSTQVAVPSDLQGPGWAFTSNSGAEPGDASSEPDNEEAQRLARLLVTEIKLYNEVAVEEGRRDGDVYSRLQEDIDRSRQIFEDRIDPAVRNDNDYFKQALVRILAGGDPALLGI